MISKNILFISYI